MPPLPDLAARVLEQGTKLGHLRVPLDPIAKPEWRTQLDPQGELEAYGHARHRELTSGYRTRQRDQAPNIVAEIRSGAHRLVLPDPMAARRQAPKPRPKRRQELIE